MNIEEKIRQTSHGNAGQRERTIALVKKIVFDGRRIDAERSEAATGLTTERLTGILRSCKVLDPFTDELVADIDTPESAIDLDSLTTEDPVSESGGPEGATNLSDASSVGSDAPAKPDSEPSEPPSKEPRRRPGRPKGSTAPNEVPTAQVPWKEPKDQGEHMRAIRESRTLKKNARFLALEAHVQLGLTSAVESVRFADVRRELTEDYLAMFTGLSDKTVRTAMAEACRLGFYQRVDNRQGGRDGQNRATYRATVPAWTTSSQVVRGETVTG